MQTAQIVIAVHFREQPFGPRTWTEQAEIARTAGQKLAEKVEVGLVAVGHQHNDGLVIDRGQFGGPGSVG